MDGNVLAIFASDPAHPSTGIQGHRCCHTACHWCSGGRRRDRGGLGIDRLARGGYAAVGGAATESIFMMVTGISIVFFVF